MMMLQRFDMFNFAWSFWGIISNEKFNLTDTFEKVLVDITTRQK